MNTFERNDLTNKSNYYRIFILLEIIALVCLFYFNVHWFLIGIAVPILFVDIYSNKRCLNRQKNFIKSVAFSDGKIICIHLQTNETTIPFEKAKFSIREKKFEKDKTEIEIKLKKALGSKLIGRLHIKNWTTIFEIKNELQKNSVTQVKYKPEGFWSKYGILTADIVITTTAFVASEVAEINGDYSASRDLKGVFMPISDMKESLKPREDEKDFKEKVDE